MKVKVLVAQSCPILYDPMDCSLPGSSVRGILQAWILEWVAIPFSRGSSWPRVWNWVSCIVHRFFTIWTTKKVHYVYNGLLDSEGEGEGGTIWENGILTCILSCKNRIASLCLMQDTACLGLVHGDDPERCYGEGGGRGVHVWERM